MNTQTAQAPEVHKLVKVQRRVAKAGALFHSVRARMRGKSSADFPAVLDSVLHRKLSHDELSELGYKPSADPEDLVKKFWCALVFETYFAGHPRVSIPVHLLPRSKSHNSHLWTDSGEVQHRKTPIRIGDSKTGDAVYRSHSIQVDATLRRGDLG